MENQFKKYHEEWVEQAKDYPTKALVVVAMELFEEQKERIENQKGKLDGMSWSPESWSE